MHSISLPMSPVRRRGAVIVFTAAMIVVLIGFASLTLDVGALYGARADLQNAADAAALSGVSMLASEAMVKLRTGKTGSISEVSSAIFERSHDVALRHFSFGAAGTILERPDVVLGWIDLGSSTSAIDSGGPPSQFNAVHVHARRSNDSPNGPVELFFASIFGKGESEVSASATAAYDDRVSGHDPGAGGPDLWPFTMERTAYDDQSANGLDAFEYDAGQEEVSTGADGVAEVHLFPDRYAPGNFGILNIGSPNQSEVYIAEDIDNGVSPEDVEIEVGTSQLTFYDDGNAVTYSITGNTGLKPSLESNIKARIGDIVAIPVHDAVDESGANAVYRVVGIRYVRVMNVDLRGGSKGLWVQPVSYTGPGVLFDPSAPSSGGVAGRFVLVR